MPEESNQAAEAKTATEAKKPPFEVPPEKYVRALEAENAELRWALAVTFPAYEEREKEFEICRPKTGAFTRQLVERIRRVLTNPPEFTGLPL